MSLRLRKIFLLGIFASAPLALTIYVVVQLIMAFDSLFRPVAERFMGVSTGQGIPGVGIVVGIVVIFLVGLAAPSLLGRQFMLYVEKIVERVPLAKIVYSGSKQIFDSFSGDGLHKLSRVVMVRFPQAETWTIGFLTHHFEEGDFPVSAEEWTTVYVPTTPNPTSGYIVFAKKKDLIFMEMSSEEALKYIISCGLTNMKLTVAKSA